VSGHPQQPGEGGPSVGRREELLARGEAATVGPPGPHRRPPPRRHADPEVARAIDDLVALLPSGTENTDLLTEIVTSAMRLPASDADRGELKILSHTLRDFHASFRTFGGHRDRRKVAIFGSARTPPESPVYRLCHDLSARLVEDGFMVITGAGPGIMRAGNEGATPANSFGVSITLPFEAASNDIIAGDPKLIEFKYFFTRKLSFVKESDAIVLFPGGFGTMDEGYESLTLLQTGKCDPLPVIMMDVPGGNYWPSWERYVRENLLQRGLISPYDRNLFRVTSSVEAAAREIELFYSCYHSLRYVGDTCILRLNEPPSERLLALLDERYGDLLAEGSFEALGGPHPAERHEPDEIKALPRIGFRFVRRRFGRLRRLIDEINLFAAAEPERAARTRPPPGGHLGFATAPDPRGDGA